ncbi:MAG: UPF0235 protein [Anaerolineaceae bacterium]|jgi:uncharacterized protein (TIGR00251 family)|nr:DUF167 domain-containing protein [Anaerolineae bacterium]MBV6467942.1 hypothetical protein [Anaerolineales bacterium]MCE7905749.1 DUF167 domain-containing protein [Anaerolineae bacterium CFX3]MDL1926523.1 DUF167 domain-containing protein [Anaerolineae bacterium AMX1]OQY82994.1 MAG: hypothetical protein B6D40_07790 [Anaerolineae bacterium UTCFX3]GER79610.1 conserved hypothetical protein [Candidatus Denitrolinea symbiosum]GIK10202.1 MAG: UPF0235 protein [Chloroflexota bacterium]GJQ40176.1 M
MSKRTYRLHDGKKGAALAVRVTPRASRNEIVEIQSDGTVKIHLTAPAHEGKANDELIKFLAGILGAPKSHIDIVAGAGGRDKLISVLDMNAEEVHQRIVGHLA